MCSMKIVMQQQLASSINRAVQQQDSLYFGEWTIMHMCTCSNQVTIQEMQLRCVPEYDFIR